MKKTKNKKSSQLILLGIIIISLIGVLIINSSWVTAEKNSTSLNVIQQETQADNSNISTGIEYSPTVFPSMFKLVGALVVVIVCIYLALFLFKKLLGKKYAGNKTNNILEILETTHLGPKKSLSLVRVADKSVLVGTTDTHITVLSELDEDKTEQILRTINTDMEKDNFTNLFQTASDKLKELSLKRKTKTVLEA